MSNMKSAVIKVRRSRFPTNIHAVMIKAFTAVSVVVNRYLDQVQNLIPVTDGQVFLCQWRLSRSGKETTCVME